MAEMVKLTVKGNKNTGKIRVAAYCRVSTDYSEQQHSYLSQKRYFTKLYEGSAHEELVGVYADSGSGTSTRYRPDMLRMLDDCLKGKIDRIITKSLSRFARNTKECLSILRELKQLGISVYFEKEAVDTARMTDEIMITILEGLAQEESASISENIRWSLKKRMMTGTLGIARVPYGYIKVNNRLVVDDEKAALVRRMFDMYLSGCGANRIAETLNDEELPSPTGKKWNNKTILKMLRQEKYVGDIHWQKTYSEFMGKKGMKNNGERDSYYIRNALPPIISRETLRAAEELRCRNTRAAKEKNLSPFRGKTKCTCGRSYYFTKRGRLPELALFADEILLPCISQMQKLKKDQAGENELELSRRIEELSDRRYVLYMLCSNGCITEEKLAQAELEINSELLAAEKELSIICGQKDNSAERLQELYDILKSKKNTDLADKLLINAVTDGHCIEFELIGGLKLKEELQ